MEVSPQEASIPAILERTFGPAAARGAAISHFVAQCFRVEVGTRRCFVKFVPVPSPAPYAYELLPSSIRTPSLLGAGTTDDGLIYSVWEWVDMTPFDPSTANIFKAGALIGRMHDATRGAAHPQIRVQGTFADQIELQISWIAQFDGEIAEQLTELMAGTQGLCDIVDSQMPRVLNQGDVGWHNLGMDGHGRVVLFDFEQASIGSPLLEFMRSWHDDLRRESARGPFLDGYCEATGLDKSVVLAGTGPLEFLRGVKFLVTGLVAKNERMVRQGLATVRELRQTLGLEGVGTA